MDIFIRLVKLFLKYRSQVLAAYICLFAGAGLALLIPRFVGLAIDQALGSGRSATLLFSALAIVAAGILRSILIYWQTYLSEFLSQRVAYDLRNVIYDRLQRFSYAFHDRSQTGQLMSRATADIDGVRMFVGFALVRGLYFLVLMLAIVVLLLTINWKLALFSLSVLPFISFRTIVISRKLRELWTNIQNGLGALGAIVQENLVGARVVRAFAREDFESRKFRQQAEIIYDQEIEANNLLASNSPVMSFALLAAMAGILWYGGRQVIGGNLTQGQLAQFLLYVVMLQMPVRMLGWVTTLFSRAVSSGERIFEIIDNISPVIERPDARDLKDVKGHVRFEHVFFGYDSHGAVLEDADFEVPPGRVVALVGTSGSGKSTIANLIPRFYDVTAGRITIDGTDIKDIALASLRRQVGLIHQEAFLFSATIRENISYGRPEATLEEIRQVARAAQLDDFIMGLPRGYDTRVGERGLTLSGGQKQRLAIARSLLLDPRIIIMDDSTSSVDTRTEFFIKQSLAALLKGRTTFIIAQRLHSVQMADLILVLKDGRIVERGTHGELLARNGLYWQLYGPQLRYEEGWGNSLTGLTAPKTVEFEAQEKTGPAFEDLDRDRQASSLNESDEIIFGQPYDSRVVSRLVKYFYPYRVAVPLTIAATLLFTFSIVANPYLVGYVIDRYIVTGDLGGLNLIIMLFLGNALLHLLSYYALIRAEAVVGQGIMLTLRRQIFDHLQCLSARFFDRNKVGRIMSRVQNDVGQLGDFLDSGAFWVTGEVISLIAIGLAMFAMDFNLALLAMSVVPPLFIFTFFWQRKARLSFIKVRQAVSLVNGALQENISGIRVIQSLVREDLNSRHFERINRANLEANLEAARLSAVMMPVVELLMALGTGLIIVSGGLSVLKGTLLIGTLVAFTLYLQRFFDPIRTLTMEYAQLQRAMASAVRIFELLDVTPEIDESPHSTRVPRLKGEIRFEGVSFGYTPGLEVLHDLDLHILPGETVALVGPTGAGKSTVMSLIARFYDVTRGRIMVDEYDLREIRPSSYRRQLGLVLQDPVLFSGTIMDNIRYGRLEAGEEEVMEVARTIGAHEFIIRLERGYDTLLQERGQNLSMGQRQLISLARALLADPAILLLDEATANVDSYSEQVLQQSLRYLLKDRTALIIAHRLSTIRDADRIVVLDQGRIVEQGRHEELYALGNLYFRLHETTYAPAGVM